MNASLPSLKHVPLAIGVGLLLLVTTCTPNRTEPPHSTQNRVLAAPTGASVTTETEDGQWLMPAKNYASTRFSGLQNINTALVPIFIRIISRTRARISV